MYTNQSKYYRSKKTQLKLSFPDLPYCIHCQQCQSLDISQLIYHCKSCVHMSRTDPVRQKFVCFSCTYSTYQSENIKKHIYKHLDYKPFACELCDYRAVQKNNLERHTAIRHSNFKQSIIPNK